MMIQYPGISAITKLRKALLRGTFAFPVPSGICTQSHGELRRLMSRTVCNYCSRADNLRVYALHFHDLSSGTFTKLPPLLPRPGSQHTHEDAFSPGQTRRTSTYLGVSFPFFCQFWCIAHDMAAVYYSSPGPIHEHVPVAFAESKFRSLLKWADDLPPECGRLSVMSHNVAEMQ